MIKYIWKMKRSEIWMKGGLYKKEFCGKIVRDNWF